MSVVDIAPLRQDFVQFVNDLPKNTLTNIITIQDEMLSTLETYQKYHSLLVEEVIESDSYRNNEISSEENRLNLNIDIHFNVIFIGFPTSSLENIKQKWYHSLNREDNIIVTFGPSGDLIMLLGSSSTRYHFHFIQISFHVTEALQNRFQLLLRDADILNEYKNNNPKKYYLNAWEIEIILNNLSKSIINSFFSENQHPKLKFIPLFILNLNFNVENNSSLPYSFHNGFTISDYKLLRHNESIFKLSKQVLNKEKWKLRIIKESAYNNIPLYNNKKHLKKTPRNSSTIFPTQQVQFDDAVKFTRKWAADFQLQTNKFNQSLTLESRALEILTASKESPTYPYQRALAMAITSIADHSLGDSDCSILCSASGWVGQERLLWHDLHSTPESPIHSLYSKSHTAPAPRILNETEWKKLSKPITTTSTTRTREENLQYLKLNQINIIRNFYHLKSLSEQLECSIDYSLNDESIAKIEELQNEVTLGNMRSLQSFHINLEELGKSLQSFQRGVDVRYKRKSCINLTYQQALLAYILKASYYYDLVYHEMNQASDAFLLLPYLNDATSFLHTILSFTLTVTGGVTDEIQLHGAEVSEEVNMYLGHLVSYTLKMVRQTVTPPMLMYRPLSLKNNNQFSMLLQSKRNKLSAFTFSSSTSSESSLTTASTGESLYDIINAINVIDEQNNHKGIKNKYQLTNAAVEENEKDEEDDDDEVQIEQDLLNWSKLSPPLLFPSHIDVVIYLFTLHWDYYTLDYGQSHGSFDLLTLQNEILKLKLPNQRLSINIIRILEHPPTSLLTHQHQHHSSSSSSSTSKHLTEEEIKILKHSLEEQEPDNDAAEGGGKLGFTLSLISCRRQSISPQFDTDGNLKTMRREYLDSECVWRHLQQYDHHHHHHNTEESSSSNGGSMNSERWKSSQFHHLPIFLISLSSANPIFLDEDQLAVSTNQAVLAIQNYQQHIPSSFLCHSTLTTINGRNPIGPVLTAVATTVGGLPPHHIIHRGSASISSIDLLTAKTKGVATKFHDFSSLGRTSPVFQLLTSSSTPSYTQLDLDFIHRSRVLRSLAWSKILLRLLVKQNRDMFELTAMTTTTTSVKTEVTSYYQQLLDLKNMFLQAINASQYSDWSTAAAYTNTILLTTLELKESVEKLENKDFIINTRASNEIKRKMKKIRIQRQQNFRLFLCLIFSILLGFVSYYFSKRFFSELFQ